MSPDGREVLLYHVKSGDSWVLTISCLLGGNAYPAEGFAESDDMAFAVPNQIFQRCLEQSGFFREFVFRNFSSRLTDVIKRMAALAFGSVEFKLAKALRAIGGASIAIPHNQLAVETGTAREVVSRHLKRFKSNGWLRLNRGQMSNIDYQALKVIIAGA